MAFANVTPAIQYDGLPYAVAKQMPAAEGDLFNGTGNDPCPVFYGQAIVAEVKLTATGNVGSNSSYVVLQGDFGDDNWYDLAWCVWTGTSGSASFLLAAGAFVGNSVQQTRASGTAPGSNGSIQCPVPGRIRFVGKSTVAGGSSSSSLGPGVTTEITATIRFKNLGLR